VYIVHTPASRNKSKRERFTITLLPGRYRRNPVLDQALGIFVRTDFRIGSSGATRSCVSVWAYDVEENARPRTTVKSRR
jgi:hypothetical protein